ncbi:NAD(P)/FAD-dependent oxidoreductase [Sabulicella rubraurantiaca]|uniref:NAD(P)-binding domain-containing protein n=1 Tax=Sabulicella rubraurantiaca TaxID=2811429 RepID=UPI001A9799D2|nr:NAD(P)-binding domain-containing protein [Sabulicella rubraurantiaca]
MNRLSLPVVVVGAGPIGLAATAHLIERNQPSVLLEAGPTPASAVREWAHVRMFSPWRFNTDAAAVRLLWETGWSAPDPDHHPTGEELVRDYLAPLAAHPALAARLRLEARVIGLSRRHHDLQRDGSRDSTPFVVQIESPSGAVEEIEARAVIDCSGTWSSPNPVGAHGLPAPGEPSRVFYGIPDVLGRDRATYAGQRTLVVGAGHSAMNVVEALADLANEAPGTDTTWAFRRPLGAANFGGGSNDGLAARGALGARARALVEEARVAALAPFLVHRLLGTRGGAIRVEGILNGRPHAVEVDRVVGATGFRPDLRPLAELRLSLDPAVQATPALAPLIDPNMHSCGTVRPHGEVELRHPEEPGLYVAGMKSYGRAPTFLLATGHEQVRSIVAHLSGDEDAARRVELALPETGVCSGPTKPHDRKASAAAGCCGAAERVGGLTDEPSCRAPNLGEPAEVSAAAQASCCQ